MSENEQGPEGEASEVVEVPGPRVEGARKSLMRDSVRDRISQELYFAWARHMGDEKPFPFGEIDQGEREAWYAVADKAAEFFAMRGSPDGLVKRCFRLWALLLGPGHGGNLILRPMRGGGFVAHRHGDVENEALKGETVTAAVLNLLRDVEATAIGKVGEIEKELHAWRTVLEGKRAK